MYLCENSSGSKVCAYTLINKPRKCNFEERSGGSYLDCQYCKKVEDLKPCPFCGSASITLKDSDNGVDEVVECMGCAAHISRPEGYRKELIEAWNKRI